MGSVPGAEVVVISIDARTRDPVRAHSGDRLRSRQEIVHPVGHLGPGPTQVVLPTQAQV